LSVRIKTAIFDTEGDGLVKTMTRLHCMAIRDYERRVTHVFRKNDVMDNIVDGVEMLEQAEMVVGHNILQHDFPAIDKVIEGFSITGKVLDTLPMCRMVFANQKDKDFRLFERGKLPGKYIGSHSLGAWGYRLGLHKGDYAAVKAEEAAKLGITDKDELVKFVWGTWSQAMEDYMVGDVDVNVLLYERIIRENWDPASTQLEQSIHDLMGQQERNGIHFDVPAATKLAEELEAEAVRLSAQATEHFGKWWKPAKKHIVKALWDDPEGKNKSKTYAKPRAEFGEDYSRPIWGEVTVPTKTLNYKDPAKASRTEGAPFCAVKLVEFNPNSRPQIIDRFQTVHGWNPVDFTETGNPEVSDDVLRTLIGHIPMAEELAEIFYYKKRLGMVRDGKNGWLKLVTTEGKIHGYCNVGGTISGRASHVSPNLAQVPKVKSKKIKQPDDTFKTIVLKGREGLHGWECRSLFYVPENMKPLFEVPEQMQEAYEKWRMTGIDLSGIELRCLGEALRPWDYGAYADIILNGDIHTHNMVAAGLDSRDTAKTFIYALIYGGGDPKLGSIIEPLASEEEQAKLGAYLRDRFMSGIPAFGALMREIKRAASRGHMRRLDGGKLYIRSKHSALNTKLQSEAALIAKKWNLLTEDYLLDAGYEHSWDKDFAFLLWIHDEQQIASRAELAPEVARLSIQAAEDAGKFFGYVTPVAAESKVGNNWAMTH
jgi:DNA polymerase I-like protein with 3'-5' exonuclease and polymerase domains